jgi:hypothetical protein
MKLTNEMGKTAIAETVATNRVVELSSEEVSMIAGGDGDPGAGDSQVAMTGEETASNVDECTTGNPLLCAIGTFQALKDALINAAAASPASAYDYQNGSDIMDNNYHSGGWGGPGGFGSNEEGDLTGGGGGRDLDVAMY